MKKPQNHSKYSLQNGLKFGQYKILTKMSNRNFQFDWCQLGSTDCLLKISSELFFFQSYFIRSCIFHYHITCHTTIVACLNLQRSLKFHIHMFAQHVYTEQYIVVRSFRKSSCHDIPLLSVFMVLRLSNAKFNTLDSKRNARPDMDAAKNFLTIPRLEWS